MAVPAKLNKAAVPVHGSCAGTVLSFAKIEIAPFVEQNCDVCRLGLDSKQSTAITLSPPTETCEYVEAAFAQTFP